MWMGNCSKDKRHLSLREKPNEWSESLRGDCDLKPNFLHKIWPFMLQLYIQRLWGTNFNNRRQTLIILETLLWYPDPFLITWDFVKCKYCYSTLSYNCAACLLDSPMLSINSGLHLSTLLIRIKNNHVIDLKV